MSSLPFLALVVSESESGRFQRRITQRRVDELPDGDLLIRVHYSSLNYKDALSASGNRGVTRRYPHTPGIDAAGIVVESRNDAIRPGDEVIVIGYDLGMNTPGGFGQYIRVPADWVVPRPPGLSLRESMIFGTAGFTAAMSVLRLSEWGITPASDEVLVTGATGGVGSLAVAILARAGFHVTAATGKAEQAPWLRWLGARTVLPRSELDDESGRPLLTGRWNAVVDTVGGNFLSTALKSTRPGGCVTCCGQVSSPELNMTVFPFILRGVALFGIDSASCPIEFRRMLWEKLATEWKLDALDELAREVGLADLNPEIDRILRGEQVGRVIVSCQTLPD